MSLPKRKCQFCGQESVFTGPICKACRSGDESDVADSEPAPKKARSGKSSGSHAKAVAPAKSSPHYYRRPPKEPGVAAVLAFFVPGLGHLYCEEFAWAILFFVGGLISYTVASFMALYVPIPGLAAIPFVLILWACQIWHAHYCAKKTRW